MYDEERENRSLYIASYSEDEPNVLSGSLIPNSDRYHHKTAITEEKSIWYIRPVFLFTLSIFLFAISIGTLGYATFSSDMSASAIASTQLNVVINEDTQPVENEHDDFIYKLKIEGIEANHYLVADLDNDTIIAASDLDDKAPIASLTKLMTALVAYENLDINSSIVINHDRFVTTLIPRLEGSYKVSLQNLLALLLSESSNEAAEAIAASIGREEFISLMNSKANEIGLIKTVFTDPSGLDEGNISSVNDIFRLLKYIYNNEFIIFELTSNQELSNTYTTGQFGQLSNFNYIDGVDFIAGKVGETIAAGQTSASVHNILVHGENRIVAVVLLGTAKRNEDTKKLINYVKEHFR